MRNFRNYSGIVPVLWRPGTKPGWECKLGGCTFQLPNANFASYERKWPQGVLFCLDWLALTCGRGPAGLTSARREKSPVCACSEIFHQRKTEAPPARPTVPPTSHMFSLKEQALFHPNPEDASDRVRGRSLPSVCRLHRLGKGWGGRQVASHEDHNLDSYGPER